MCVSIDIFISVVHSDCQINVISETIFHLRNLSIYVLLLLNLILSIYLITVK